MGHSHGAGSRHRDEPDGPAAQGSLPAKKEIAFDVPEKRKQAPTRRPQPRKPPPKAAKTPPPPIPTLASAVGGIDVGLWGGSQIDLSDANSALLGEAGNVVMTADSVDAIPSIKRQGSPPSYPAAARARGDEGLVVLLVDFDAAGRITNLEVASSDPPGVFDDAATRFVRGTSFNPAMYQGQPVPVTGVEIPVPSPCKGRTSDVAVVAVDCGCVGGHDRRDCGAARS